MSRFEVLFPARRTKEKKLLFFFEGGGVGGKKMGTLERLEKVGLGPGVGLGKDGVGGGDACFSASFGSRTKPSPTPLGMDEEGPDEEGSGPDEEDSGPGEEGSGSGV